LAKLTRNSELLESFTKYCEAYPDLRFWQALRNWCGWGFVLVTDQYGVIEDAIDTGYELRDTFYWETNQHPEGD
jgi:hypothetical protein